jgi:predicted nucleic acid-binding protein
LDRAVAPQISDDLRRNRPVVVPAHFEADAYAGFRRMVSAGRIERGKLTRALADLADLVHERFPLPPLLDGAYRLFDQVGAHDAFYVVLARAHEAPLLTTDGGLARAARIVGVDVLYHDPGAEPIH